VCERERERESVCVCVYIYSIYTYIYMYTYTLYTYTYIYPKYGTHMSAHQAIVYVYWLLYYIYTLQTHVMQMSQKKAWWGELWTGNCSGNRVFLKFTTRYHVCSFLYFFVLFVLFKMQCTFLNAFCNFVFVIFDLSLSIIRPGLVHFFNFA
jgi:hypothetical protein